MSAAIIPNASSEIAAGGAVPKRKKKYSENDQRNRRQNYRRGDRPDFHPAALRQILFGYFVFY